MPSTDPNRGADSRELTGFDRLYGLEFVELGEDVVRARVAVTEDHLQPAGVLHGGVYAAMAESTTSIATWFAVGGPDGGKAAIGMNNNTSFLRPITTGHVNSYGRARHRGRTTWVWEVDLTDDDGQLAAISRVTVAIRDL